MINELYKLSQSLEHYGLLKSTTHPDINKVGKTDCLCIELDKNGMPRGIRLLQKAQTAELWKHSKGCHNSFPAIRVKKPLLLPKESQKADDSAWKKAKLSEQISMLSHLDYSALNTSCNDIKISEWTEKQLNPVLLSNQPALAALKQLITVFPREGQQTAFLQHLIQLLHKEILRCEQGELLDIIKKLLIGAYDSKTGKFVADCMTYYDMYAVGEYNNSVDSPETRNALIELLNNASVLEISEKRGKSVISPFTGEEAAGIGSKYPNPNMPLLGLTYLYSKKSDTPCLTRYTMAGTDAFQAGAREIYDINDAVAFLTKYSKKNKTWCPMSDSNREKPNLLMAYLPDEPQNNAQLAKVLGEPSDFDNFEEYRENAESSYEALCKQVIGSLKDVMRKNPNTKINLIILETLDPGRKQIVYENAFIAKQFCENLITWNNASRNTPCIKIRIRRGKEIVNMKPICPGPSEICQLFKINYTRSGAGKPIKQSDVSLHEIYRLYMPNSQENRKQTLNRFFQLTVQKSRWLLSNTAYQMITDYALPSTKQSQTQAKQAEMFVSLLSILLYLSDIRKENYMLDAPFNIGQFLKLADMLHKEYCVQVRNSGKRQASLPAQLMGNEMLSIAAENPVEGLNRLRDRMRIYLAWAQSATGENAGYAKWILARFEEVSRKISDAGNEIPERFTPVQQAQVLLGYLADIPYEKKKQGFSDKSNLKEENSDE